MTLRRSMMLLAPAALLLGLSTISSAAVTANGSFGFAVLGCCSLDGGPTGTGDLMTASTLAFSAGTNFLVTTNDAMTFGSPNDFQSLFFSFGSILPNGLDLTIPFNPIAAQFGPGNDYNFTASSQLMSVSVPTRTISFYFLGMFSDAGTTFNPSSASLTLSFNQSAPNASISGSGTLSTPPTPLNNTPEPASMALLGSALIGLGLFGRKRLARR